MLKLHVEVTVLNPDKKKKATAAWVVFEGKAVRGAGRISNDPKGLIATAAGRTFAAALHAAHGKLVNPTTIPVGAPADDQPAKATGKRADAAEKPAKGKSKKATNGATASSDAGAAIEVVEAKPTKKTKGKKADAVATDDQGDGEAADAEPAKKSKGNKAAANGEGHEIGNGNANGDAEKPAKKANGKTAQASNGEGNGAAEKPVKKKGSAKKPAKKSKKADAAAEA